MAQAILRGVTFIRGAGGSVADCLPAQPAKELVIPRDLDCGPATSRHAGRVCRRSAATRLVGPSSRRLRRNAQRVLLVPGALPPGPLQPDHHGSTLSGSRTEGPVQQALEWQSSPPGHHRPGIRQARAETLRGLRARRPTTRLRFPRCGRHVMEQRPAAAGTPPKFLTHRS